MRKFKHIETGAILVPNNKMVIEQLAKSEYYEEVGAKAPAEEKSIKDMTKKELIAYLTEKGIDCNVDMKKDELLLLVPETTEE